MAKLEDLFDDLSEFEDLLADAQANAETQWEMDFVDELTERHNTYGDATYLSEKQLDILEQIAKGE